VPGIPAPPVTSAAELWLFTGGSWRQLAPATRVPSRADEIVNAKAAGGGLARINSVLILEGVFQVPEDLYNTVCFLAHEGVIYQAYYISHCGDVARGTKTASLKVNQVLDYAGFAEMHRRLGRPARPTADLARMARFGKRYRAPLSAFAGGETRLS